MSDEAQFASLHDTGFWVLLATIGFGFVLWKYARKPILAMLDARTDKIKADLDEAERLKNEAQDLLSESQRKHRDAIQTSQKIIENAKETALRIQKEAEERIAETAKRKEEQLLERIARAEASAVAELRHQAADIAAKSAEILLQEAMDKRGSKLIDEAISDIPTRLAG